LEIGGFKGRSTICMAQVALSVDSVDDFLGDPSQPDVVPGGTQDEMLANLKRYSLPRVTVHVGKSSELAKTLPESSFDLAFIDGLHDVKSVWTDTQACLRLLKSGGVIAFHDWCYITVREAAKRLLGRDPDGIVGSLAWFTIREK